MINKIILTTSKSHNPYENLSLEEFMLFNLKNNEMIVFLWQNEHTVVIGHNQNAYTEVNLKALNDDNGLLVRRITGGGAVYHDLGNLNFSLILNKEDYDVKNQLYLIAESLQQFSIKAEISGRNDMSVDGRKISGNAFYDNKEKCLHHGTILINTKIDALSKYLNVKEDKLKSKGVKSVGARVINLKELNQKISVEKVIKSIFDTVKRKYKNAEFEITDNEKLKNYEVVKLINKYKDKKYIFGDDITLSSRYEKRFPWGGVDIRMNINKGIIGDIKIYSDSLDTESIGKAELLIKGMDILKPVNTENEIIKDIINLIIS